MALPFKIPGIPEDAAFLVAVFVDSQGQILTAADKGFDFRQIKLDACDEIGKMTAETIRMKIRQATRLIV